MIFDGALDMTVQARFANTDPSKFIKPSSYNVSYYKKLVNKNPLNAHYKNMLEKYEKEAQVGKPFSSPPDFDYPGRVAKGWDAAVACLKTPWPEARQRVEYVQEKVRQSNMPTPKSVKRKPRWSEDDGEVDVDRALRGEVDVYRQISRQRKVGPNNIALVTNLDLPYSCNESGLFYRSTVCIAAADLLEDLGYSVEIWAWCLGYAVYPSPFDKQCHLVKVKELGAPMNVESLCDCLSAWFTRYIIFGAFPCSETPPISYGGALTAVDETGHISKCGLRGWEKYLDITEGVLAVPVPGVSGSLDNAVETTRKFLENVIVQQDRYLEGLK